MKFKTMIPDPPIDEIRRIRHQISEEHGQDPKKILAYYQALQETMKDRIVSFAPKKKLNFPKVDVPSDGS